MKRFIASAQTLSILLLSLPVLLSAFSSKTESPVTFQIEASVSNGENTGTFESSGMEESSGQFTEDYTFNGKKVHSEVTFIYTNGTVTAKTHCDVTLTSSSTATGSGSWIITKGTGVYSGIKGSGTLSLQVSGIGSENEHISQNWSGTIK